MCDYTSVASLAIIFIIVANIVNVVFSLQCFSGAYLEDIWMYMTTALESIMALAGRACDINTLAVCSYNKKITLKLNTVLTQVGLRKVR